MPKTPTAPTETTAKPAGLDALRQRIAKMEADAAAAHEEEQRLAADAEKLREEARKRHAQREKLEREIQQAEREATDLIRATPPPAVTLEVATEVAERLLATFDDGNDEDGSTPAEQRAARLWESLDDCRCRLLTLEVDQDARPLVLAIEAIVAECDAWESLRRPEAAGARAADGEALADLRWQSLPSGSNQVRALVAELRMIVAGETPEHATEGLGQLLAEGVSPNQIAKMHGMVLPDGSADLQAMGVAIDRSLGAAGFYREVNMWRHLKAVGALNRSDAWTLRSRSLEARRKASHSLPGAAQRAGTLRVGRMTSPPGDEPVDHRPLHLSDPKHAFYHRSKTTAEAAARQAEPAGTELTGDQVRDGLHQAMSGRQ